MFRERSPEPTTVKMTCYRCNSPITVATTDVAMSRVSNIDAPALVVTTCPLCSLITTAQIAQGLVDALVAAGVKLRWYTVPMDGVDHRCHPPLTEDDALDLALALEDGSLFA